MAQSSQNQELIDRFTRFYRNYCRDAISQLAQRYPNEQRSLYVDYDDLYTFDPDLAEDYLDQPDQFGELAEEALRLYDLPADVSLGQAHVRLRNLPDTVAIRDIRVHDNHVGRMVAVSGIVRKATDVRPKITDAAFECQRCGTMTYIPQSDGSFQEPHECQGCERQGPFRVNYDQSEFVDSQKLRIQESPEGLRGGETPQSIDVNVEDDVTGRVTAGDHVTVTGVLHIEQVTQGNEKSQIFDLYMDGVSVEIEDEEFEDMEITEADKRDIVELSNHGSIYEEMVASVAPSIYGYDQEKLAMILQLFSGVTKHLPDGSRIRGDLHMLLIGDPGTGKCVAGDTRVTLADGREVAIRDLVERNLDDPTPVDDGVYDETDVDLLSVTSDGELTTRCATRAWKREAPDHLYRVRTASGRELEVTPSHPLFVQDGDGLDAVRADELDAGDSIAVSRASEAFGGDAEPFLASDGGTTAKRRASPTDVPNSCRTNDVFWDRIDSIEPVDSDDDWVYDLEVTDTHSYLANGVVSHNSQLLSYIQNIAPRSVYTSGKGSSSAGLTAAAVRDDFGDGQQWTLEAGALVLADKGIAAVDELDKMRCVTGETFVQLADGSVRRIRELAREAAEAGEIESLSNGRTIRNLDVDAWTMTDDGRIVSRPVTAIHEYEAPDELTDVRLETGERLTATDEHPFFVFEEGERVERSAADLEPGDWVYVPRQLRGAAADGGVAASDSSFDTGVTEGERFPAFGALLGYLSGDGNVYYDRDHGSYGIRFTNAEEELLADFERACREVFDAEPTRPPSEHRSDGVETVRLAGREYADAVLDAGMNLETYDQKAFPGGVSHASRATKAAFVRALADSEGTVDTHTGNVRIYSSSYEILLGTKQLLLEFDVSTQIQTRERDEGRDLYVLAITDADSLRAFDRHVGFVLDRKSSALDTVRSAVSGDRPILDVVPDCGGLIADCRDSLRLYQDECGIAGTTYCDFENGDANVSLRLAQTILDSFERRREDASRDLDVLSDVPEWGTLERLKDRYHVSQSELASEITGVSQQAVSRGWGTDSSLRIAVAERLRAILSNVAATDLSRFRELVDGDVKWRRVTAVETVKATANDDRIDRLKHELADLLGCDATRALDRARTLLDGEPRPETWADLRILVDRYSISRKAIAGDVGVDGSTISRWLRGIVETDRFEDVRAAILDRVETARSRLHALVVEIEDRRDPRVYDLSVEGTHNFVANGMVVHNSEDRSAMHEALEQQQISISKAGINATLKSRCSLLGAANPKYGRFDQYEPIGEQIDLEPALISRFDLIFTVTDQPDPDEDAALADHILRTNYAGELNTQRTELANPEFTSAEVDEVTDTVEPAIDPDLLRKYIAYAKRNCYPTMTEEARAAIREFYVDLRAKGADEDAPVPVTARKLEALVRLSEASARVRLSDAVEREDAERVIEIVRSCLQDIGVDPETGEFDADVIETGTSKSQRDRIKNIKDIIEAVDADYEEEAGAPLDAVVDRAAQEGIEEEKVHDQIEQLRRKGDLYSPTTDQFKVV